MRCPVVLKNLQLPVEFKFQQWLARQVIQALPNMFNLTFAYISLKLVYSEFRFSLRKAPAVMTFECQSWVDSIVYFLSR